MEDLRGAVKLDGTLEACYGPLLARATFALEDFREAAGLFERGLEDRTLFTDPDGPSQDYLWELLFSAAWAYRLAGDHERAIETMRKGVGANASLPGAAWWIARWYSECGRYEDAAQFLKLESENELYPPESWLLSSILALAEVAKTEEDRAQRFVEDLARKNPVLLQVMRGVIQEHWPSFVKLQPDSQRCSLHAVCETHAEPIIPEGVPENYRSAVRDYGYVVEHELKSKIFDRFREHVIKDAELLRKSREEYERARADPFLSFIRWDQRGITLGQMIAAIETSAQPATDTQKALFQWVKRRFVRIYDCIPALKEMNAERVRATHQSPVYERGHVLEIASKCREALDWI